MEGNEIEMTKDELQKWIRRKVKKNRLIATDLLEKRKLLQCLLEKRKNQAAHLLKLCESVAACEAIVKKQYSLLGWEYTDINSDDDDNEDDDDDDDDDVAVHEYTPPSRLGLSHYETEVSSSPNTNDAARLLPKFENTKEICSGKKIFIDLRRQPVVVLTRLPPCKIRALCSPAQNHSREVKSLNNTADDDDDDDDDVSSDIGNSTSRDTESDKWREVDQKNEKLAISRGTHARMSALCKSTTQHPPSTSRANICVNMNVLFRRKGISWQRGKIVDIVINENSRLKYKICFEKGESLVSGNHIAFDCMPKMEELFVGARVVVKRKAEKPRFSSGVVAELPSVKNHMRFLVFIDDHTPVYVGVTLLHLVCRPLVDSLYDIQYDAHRDFMREYIKVWPYPPQSQYRVGQTINAELNGVHHRCEVQAIDCSLIQVVFQKDQHKEWIYRGSMRLEHVINV